MGDIIPGNRGAYRDYNKNDDPKKMTCNPKGFWDKDGKYRSGNTRKERKRKKCGAKLRKKDEDGNPRYCKKWAMRNGRCRLHGGRNQGNGGHKTAGAKKGHQATLSTGEFESIWHSVLSDEENLFVAELKLDAETMLNEELKLITVRERRMMQRIADLADKEFTVVQKTLSQEKGMGKGGAIDLVSEDQVSEATLGQIQKLEEALTRIQEKKAKLIDLKLKVQEMNDGDDGAIDDLVKVLDSSRKRLKRTKGVAPDINESDETEE